MLKRSEIRRGIAREVVRTLDEQKMLDEDTEVVVGALISYIVDGWWTLSGGDIQEWKRIVQGSRQQAVAWICSMISMAHAIRSGEADRWVAETTGAS